MLSIAGALHAELVLITSPRRGDREVKSSPGRDGAAGLNRNKRTYLRHKTTSTQWQMDPADIHVSIKHPCEAKHQHMNVWGKSTFSP